MRIVSWNCGGSFREKFQLIQSLQADIYVIQECENPVETRHNAYASFANNHLWCGKSKNKGLGIFASNTVQMTENNWEKPDLHCFLSANINAQFDLVGVWACKPYIEEYCSYQQININRINSSTVIIGDFNSNRLWDKKHGQKNHSSVVARLANKGLSSAYHYTTGEEQCQESIATFYMHRNLTKPYHIDHCFVANQRLSHYKICENANDWLKSSDHIPIVLDIDVE